MICVYVYTCIWANMNKPYHVTVQNTFKHGEIEIVPNISSNIEDPINKFHIAFTFSYTLLDKQNSQLNPCLE